MDHQLQDYQKMLVISILMFISFEFGTIWTAGTFSRFGKFKVTGNGENIVIKILFSKDLTSSSSWFGLTFFLILWLACSEVIETCCSDLSLGISVIFCCPHSTKYRMCRLLTEGTCRLSYFFSVEVNSLIVMKRILIYNVVKLRNASTIWIVQ